MLVIYQMDFDNTRWSCPWNSDSQQLYTKHCQRYGVYGVSVCVHRSVHSYLEQTEMPKTLPSRKLRVQTAINSLKGLPQLHFGKEFPSIDNRPPTYLVALHCYFKGSHFS